MRIPLLTFTSHLDLTPSRLRLRTSTSPHAYELNIDSQTETSLSILDFKSGANPPKGSYAAVIRLGCQITGGTVENLDFPVQVNIA